MMSCKNVLILFTLFLGLSANALNVENYYTNTSKGYFNYFYPKLFHDPDLGIDQASDSDKKFFNEVFSIWLDQVDSWSFKKNNSKIYYLNLYYTIRGNQKNLTDIIFYFKDIKKINFFLQNRKTKPILNWQSDHYGIRFSPQLKIQNFIKTQDPIRRPNVREFEVFPSYLFHNNSEMFEFFFKEWRIPIESLVFENKRPVGFYIP